MALFRRSDRTAERISAFWQWWNGEGRAQATASVSTGDSRAFAKAIGRRVGALGELAWSLAPGDASAHVLVISAEGDPSLRSLARRIVLAAPDADESWSYVDARPPAPDVEGTSVALAGGEPVSFGDFSVAARLRGARFDVHVHHPVFVDVSERQRAELALVALDAALGETDVALWLGEIVPTEAPPLDGFGLQALRAVVLDLKRQYIDADGRPRWVSLKGETQGGPLAAEARVPLHPLTAPLLDTYVAVVLPYTDRDDTGMPRDGSLARLQDFEQRLDGELGRDGSVVAHQSVAGVRTLHIYVDHTAGVMPLVSRLATDWPEGPAPVQYHPDPAWDSVRQFRA